MCYYKISFSRVDVEIFAWLFSVLIVRDTIRSTCLSFVPKTTVFLRQSSVNWLGFHQRSYLTLILLHTCKIQNFLLALGWLPVYLLAHVKSSVITWVLNLFDKQFKGDIYENESRCSKWRSLLFASRQQYTDARTRGIGDTNCATRCILTTFPVLVHGKSDLFGRSSWIS